LDAICESNKISLVTSAGPAGFEPRSTDFEYAQYSCFFVSFVAK